MTRTVPATPTVVHTDQAASARAALRLCVMACLVGALLAALTLWAMPLRYVGHDERWVTWSGIPHGWLYLVLLVAWGVGRLIGTVPTLSSVAEPVARKDVRRELAAAEGA